MQHIISFDLIFGIICIISNGGLLFLSLLGVLNNFEQTFITVFFYQVYPRYKINFCIDNNISLLS